MACSRGMKGGRWSLVLGCLCAQRVAKIYYVLRKTRLISGRYWGFSLWHCFCCCRSCLRWSLQNLFALLKLKVSPCTRQTSCRLKALSVLQGTILFCRHGIITSKNYGYFIHILLLNTLRYTASCKSYLIALCFSSWRHFWLTNY